MDSSPRELDRESRRRRDFEGAGLVGADREDSDSVVEESLFGREFLPEKKDATLFRETERRRGGTDDILLLPSIERRPDSGFTERGAREILLIDEVPFKEYHGMSAIEP